MDSRKQEETEQKKQARAQDYLICQGCGRKVKSEVCSWEEDNGGRIYCHDCRVEAESCGCSD